MGKREAESTISNQEYINAFEQEYIPIPTLNLHENIITDSEYKHIRDDCQR